MKNALIIGNDLQKVVSETRGIVTIEEMVGPVGLEPTTNGL